MSYTYAPDQASAVNDRSSATSLRLQGLWLAAGRAIWLAAAVLLVGLYVVSLPPYYRLLTTNPAPDMGHGRELAAGVVQLGMSPEFYALLVLSLETVLALGFTAVALVIFLRKSSEWIGLFASFALLAFGLPFTRVWQATGEQYPALESLVSVLGSVGFVSFFILFYIFPNGRFVPRWTRFAAAWWVLAETTAYLPPSMAPVTEVVAGLPVTLVLVATCPIAQVYRFRRVSDPAQRQQTKWVVFGFVGAASGFVLRAVAEGWVTGSEPPGAAWVLVDLVTGPLMVAGFLMVPVSLGFAILRYRLWDIDTLISRTIAYALLTACVIGFYALVVVGIGSLVGMRGNLLLSLLATGVIAVLFQPLRGRVQRAVNRLMFGERDEPYGVLAGLGRRLEGTLAPDEVLPSVVETVAHALKLPYAAIALSEGDGERVVAEYGDQQPVALRLPLVYRAEAVGEMLLAARGPGEAFSPADLRLLDDIARQAGVAAHTVRLTTDLQRSRERIVTAREEERRRLRRDLHDGLGPVLASFTLKLDAAGNLMERDPAAAGALLKDAKAQSQAAVADIRRLVYELRPPALDDLGLVPALAEHIAQLNHAGAIRISLNAPERLPPLPAAVEVAAYRIVQEALTNVVRHSQAHNCAVRLAYEDGALMIEVSDDGVGIQAASRAGVGLTSMRERAEELGGTCAIQSTPGGGTRVVARLPLPKE